MTFAPTPRHATYEYADGRRDALLPASESSVCWGNTQPEFLKVMANGPFDGIVGDAILLQRPRARRSRRRRHAQTASVDR